MPLRTQELPSSQAELPTPEHELYETAAQLRATELDITTSCPERTQPERLDMQLSAIVGDQLGSAQETPAQTGELQAPDAKFLPTEHEFYGAAAQLKAAVLEITSQQQLLSTMLRSVSEGVVIVDCNGRVLMENEAAIRIVGYSARLVGAQRWCEAVGAYHVDGDRPLQPEEMPTMRACMGDEVRGLELVLHGVAHDRNIHIEVRSSPLRGVDGKIVGAIANFNDITERRHAAAVEARLAALVRSTRAAVITWDSDGKVVDWNDGATRLLGYTAGEMVGRDLSVLSMAGDRREFGGNANPTQTPDDREVVMRRKDGRLVDVAWTETLVRDTKGNVVGSAGIGADLSERTHLERQVARLADEQRRQFGHQVHDSLGQQLTAIGLLLGTLRSRLGTGDSAADVMCNLERCVDEAKAQMRAIVAGLAPLKIDAHGLQFALSKLAQGTAVTHGIACTLECSRPVALHDGFTANELYLIAREAVHNAVKHGRPGSILIRLESSQGLLLQIRDDGVGIAGATGERAQEGFGLRIMRYRARLIGATLKVARGANGGTVVTCTKTQTPAKPALAQRLPLQMQTAKTTGNDRT